MHSRFTPVTLLALLLTAVLAPGVFAVSTPTRCIINAIGFLWIDGILTATGSGVSKTATLKVKPATAVPLYFSNLTVTPTTVTGGGSATVTVTLSGPAPVGGLTVPLTSDNNAVSVPANVVIAAGTTSKTFSVTTSSVSASTIVTLSGSYNGWIQGDVLKLLPTTLPPGLSFTMPPVHAAPGNGCTILSWNRLPDGTVNGYNVYRTSGGTKTLLTSTPFTGNFYPITGLTNGTTYTYQVAAVDFLGQEHTLSTSVSVTPSSATATLSWVNPPSAVTDRLLMSVSLPSGESVFGTSFFIDGQEFDDGGSSYRYVNGVQTIVSGAGFDSTLLSNGPHTVQFIGFVDLYDTIACVTPPITIQVNNTISNDKIENNWFTPGQDLCFASATVPAGSTWTVQATSLDGTSIFRTWQGGSSLVNLAWDGKDGSGNLLPPADTYALVLTVQPPGSSPQTVIPIPLGTKRNQSVPNAAGVVKKVHPVKMMQGQPIALALISVGASYYIDSNGLAVATPAQDIMLANTLTTAYTTLFGAGDRLRCGRPVTYPSLI